MTGLSTRANSVTSPARSASRMTPSHNAMMPISEMEIVTATPAISKLLSATSFKVPCTPPIKTAQSTSPSQI